MTPARRPRRLADAVGAARGAAAPATLLAAVQSAWPGVAGDAVAEQSSPVAERDGVVTVSCHSAVWAQELDLLQDGLLERLNEALQTPVSRLRFTADAARHERPD